MIFQSHIGVPSEKVYGLALGVPALRDASSEPAARRNRASVMRSQAAPSSSGSGRAFWSAGGVAFFFRYGFRTCDSNRGRSSSGERAPERTSITLAKSALPIAL